MPYYKAVILPAVATVSASGFVSDLLWFAVAGALATPLAAGAPLLAGAPLPAGAPRATGFAAVPCQNDEDHVQLDIYV